MVYLKSHGTLLLLLSIFFLAAFLRFYHLSLIPFGVHRDEIINGYVGRFILQNGKDLYGNPWPLFYFNKFGDYPPVLPMYIMGVATFVFGLSEFGIRFSSAFFGSLTVFPIYLCALSIYKNKRLALFSPLCLAILPWHIVLSRDSAEGILAVCAYSCGLALILLGTEKKRLAMLSVGALCFLATYFLYPSFRILVPLSLIPFPFIVSEKKLRRAFIAMVIIACIITALISATPWGRARFIQTSIFYNPALKAQLQTMANDEGKGNILTARIFDNKLLVYSRSFIEQYLSYYSTQFLFTQGGLPYEYIVPDEGLAYYTFALLLLAFFLLTQIKVEKRWYYYCVFLFFSAAIPAALTTDFVPHVHRSLFMVIPLTLILPAGFLKIQKPFENRKRILFVIHVIFFVFLSLEVIYFYHQYLSHTSSYKSFFKFDGFREVTQYVMKNGSMYQAIYMPSESLPLYYLFYTKDLSPKYSGAFHDSLTIRSIGKITFVDNPCVSLVLANKPIPQKSLIIDKNYCTPLARFTKIGAIMQKDSATAFTLLTPVAH